MAWSSAYQQVHPFTRSPTCATHSGRHYKGSVNFGTGSAGGKAGSIEFKVGSSAKGGGSPIKMGAGSTSAPGADGGSVNLSGGGSKDGKGGTIQIQVSEGAGKFYFYAMDVGYVLWMWECLCSILSVQMRCVNTNQNNFFLVIISSPQHFPHAYEH